MLASEADIITQISHDFVAKKKKGIEEETLNNLETNFEVRKTKEFKANKCQGGVAKPYIIQNVPC